MSHLFSSGDSLDATLQEPLGRRLIGDLFISIALVAVLVLAVNLLFLSRALAGSDAAAAKAAWRHAGVPGQAAAVRDHHGSAYRAARPQTGARP